MKLSQIKKNDANKIDENKKKLRIKILPQIKKNDAKKNCRKKN